MLAPALILRVQAAEVVETEGRVVITKPGAKPAPATVGLGLAARGKLGTANRAVLRLLAVEFGAIEKILAELSWEQSKWAKG